MLVFVCNLIKQQRWKYGELNCSLSEQEGKRINSWFCRWYRQASQKATWTQDMLHIYPLWNICYFLYTDVMFSLHGGMFVFCGLSFKVKFVMCLHFIEKIVLSSSHNNMWRFVFDRVHSCYLLEYYCMEGPPVQTNKNSQRLIILCNNRENAS